LGFLSKESKKVEARSQKEESGCHAIGRSQNHRLTKATPIVNRMNDEVHPTTGQHQLRKDEARTLQVKEINAAILENHVGRLTKARSVQIPLPLFNAKTVCFRVLAICVKGRAAAQGGASNIVWGDIVPWPRCKDCASAILRPR
jgi:hypothetical protein